MSVTKYISINEIIAKYLSDSDILNEQIRVSDIIVWCGEALKKIGGYNALEKKVAGKGTEPLLTISQYKAKLPCDCYKIVQLGFSTSETGNFVATRVSTGNFDVFQDGTNIGENTTGDDIVYSVRPPYIHINQESGYGLLSYLAIKTDDDGYPMVPDGEYVKEALYWYVQMKSLYPMWLRGKVRDAQYAHAETKWHTYCQAAYGSIMMPESDDEMESIMNVWNRMIPLIGAHGKSMKYIGEQEKFYRSNGQ